MLCNDDDDDALEVMGDRPHHRQWHGHGSLTVMMREEPGCRERVVAEVGLLQRAPQKLKAQALRSDCEDWFSELREVLHRRCSRCGPERSLESANVLVSWRKHHRSKH